MEATEEFKTVTTSRPSGPVPGLSSLLAPATTSSASPIHLPTSSSSASASAISNAYALHGNTLRTNHAAQLKTQLEVFQQLLWAFSTRHGKEIRADPRFRAEFARMCHALGVDPLLSSASGSSSKGKLWGTSDEESHMRDFYLTLGVRIVETCRSTRAENGGMMSLEEVRARIIRRSADFINSATSSISAEDVRKAVRELEPLGPGFSIVKLAGTEMIRSVPRELNTDQGAVLEVITVLGGWVTVSVLRDNLHWEQARVVSVINDMMGEGLVWVDEQAESREREYWSPTAIRESSREHG
jgi:ESCRT-II complex subunit VPS22